MDQPVPGGAQSSAQTSMPPSNQSSPHLVLWSRYKRIQELITGPILPLVVLIGPLQCTTGVQRIIRDQMKQIRQQAAQATSMHELQETSKHNIRIKCYEFYHTYRSAQNPDGQLEMPPFYKEQQYGFNGGLFKKHANQHELGHIKLRFFDSITVYKPAVTVMIFDWQTQSAASFDWPRCENKILEEVKSFQERCPVTAKDTRIILLIMLPLSGETPVDKCRTSLKNALQQSQQNHEESSGLGVKQVLMMPKGIEGLRSNPKDFIKKVIEQCGQFYANKKRDIKAKQRKLVSKEQAEHVRYFFKVGIYSQLSKGDLLASMKHIKQAYDDLRASTTTGALMTRQAVEERRENADIIMIQLLVYLLDQRNYDGFIKQFQAHLHAYKNQFEEMISKAQSTNAYTYYLAKMEEQRWRANWHITIAKMLESKPILFNDSQNIYQGLRTGNTKNRQGAVGPSSHWLTDTQLESLFSGYHHLNCMLSLLRRRQELKRLIETFKASDGSGKDIHTKLREDIKDTMLLDKSKMLGREYTLGKNTNPLLEQSQQSKEGTVGGLGLSAAQTQQYLEKHKLLLLIEGIDDLNLQILRSGQIALSSYKAKNQLMAQYDVENPTNNYKFMKAQCHRMIQFIHFHLSSHIFDLKEDQDRILEGETPLAKVCRQANFVVDEHLLKEAQKYRDQVASSLMADGWQSEGIAFLEDNRRFQETLSREQGRPDDFFHYELQILNHSKTLSRDERCQRFLDLVNMDYSGLNADQGPVVSKLHGAGLIWARARFDREMGQEVQVNQWVKLTVEVFSRLKGEGVDVATLKACFNDDGFDFERDGAMLTRETPITIEQEIYLDEAKVYKHLRSKDKLLSLILENVVIKLRDKPILFCLYPYLTAKDKIEQKMNRKGAGLKLPVTLPIKDMPPMLEFKFDTAAAVQETLIGNKHRFQVAIKRQKNVNLKSLKLHFEHITYSGGDGALRQEGDDPVSQVTGDRANEFRDPYLQSRRTAIQGIPSRRTDLAQNMTHASVMQVSRKGGAGNRAAGGPGVAAAGEASVATDTGLSDEQLLTAPKAGDGSRGPADAKDQPPGAEAQENEHPLGPPKQTDAKEPLALFEPHQDEKAFAAGGGADGLKEFEIGYQYGQALLEDVNAESMELDYPSQSVIEFPKTIIAKIKEIDGGMRQIEGDDGDIADLHIFFTFFEPSMNYAALKFTYTFTQTYEDASDLLGLKQAKESVEFTQDFSYVLKIRSIQPFDILWGLVRASDPFLRINDAVPHMPGQQPHPAGPELKTALDQKFKVWCKVRNVSSAKPLKITKTALQLVLGTGEEDVEDAQTHQKIKKTKVISLLAQASSQMFGLSSQQNVIHPREQMQFMSESVAVMDAEIECLFNNQDNTTLGIGDAGLRANVMGPADHTGGGRGGGTAGNLQIDDFMKIKKLRAAYHTSYVVQNPFRLDLSWCEVDEGLGPAPFQAPKLVSAIESSVLSPQSLHLIKVPIRVELLGEIAAAAPGSTVPVTTLKLERPVQVVYRISNLCEHHIFECVALLDVQSKHFYASGDVRSRFEIMPLDQVELEFQLLPLQLGLHNLPKLHIIDKTVNHEAMQLQGKMLNDAEFLQSLKEKNQPVGYLIKGFTRRVLIQN